MSLFLAKKQENTNQKKVCALLRLKDNKKCFDCQAKGPTFANTTIQSFICARCSDLVRELGHRVKVISASKFSGAELLALKKGGNAVAQKIWASNYIPPENNEPESDENIRLVMRQMYYENKWLDRALFQSHKEEVRALIAKSFNEDGLPIVTKKVKTKAAPGFSRLPLIADNEMNIMDGEDEEDEEYESYDFCHTASSHQAVSYPTVPSPVTDVVPERISAEKNRVSIESQRSRMSTSSGSVYSKSSVHDNTEENNCNSYWSGMNTHSHNDGSMVPPRQHLKLTEPFTPNQQEFDEQQYDQSVPNTIFSSTSSSLMKQENKVNDIPYSQPVEPELKSFSLVDIDNTVTSESMNKSSAPYVTPKVKVTSPSINLFDSIISDLSGLKLEKTTRRATYTGGILAPSVSMPLEPTKSISSEVKDRPASMFNSDFFAKFNQSTLSSNKKDDQYAALREVNPVISYTKEDDKHIALSSEDEDEDDPWQDFCSSSNESDFNMIQTEIKSIKPSEPIVSIDLFSDLDPLSMFRKL